MKNSKEFYDVCIGIMGERDAQYSPDGDKAASFRRTGEIIHSILETYFERELPPVPGRIVAAICQAIKLIRQSAPDPKEDTFLDMANYAFLAYDCWIREMPTTALNNAEKQARAKWKRYNFAKYYGSGAACAENLFAEPLSIKANADSYELAIALQTLTEIFPYPFITSERVDDDSSTTHYRVSGYFSEDDSHPQFSTTGSTKLEAINNAIALLKAGVQYDSKAAPLEEGNYANKLAKARANLDSVMAGLCYGVMRYPQGYAITTSAGSLNSSWNMLTGIKTTELEAFEEALDILAKGASTFNAAENIQKEG